MQAREFDSQITCLNLLNNCLCPWLNYTDRLERPKWRVNIIFCNFRRNPWSHRAHLHMVGMLHFMSNMNQPSLPTPFYSVLVSISVFVALSTAFHSITSSDNSLFSDAVLPVSSLPYWSFQLYIYIVYESLLQFSCNP